jgi:hypothetical protein
LAGSSGSARTLTAMRSLVGSRRELSRPRAFAAAGKTRGECAGRAAHASRPTPHAPDLTPYTLPAERQKRASQVSGGERNRVHLARMLKEGANVLLLDEPTNDLDVKAVRRGGHAPLHPPSRRSSPPSPHARAGKAGRSLGAPSRTLSTASPAAPSSSPTAAGSSTGSRPTSSPSRARAR